MAEHDLDWVVACEQDLHAFPWTRGNFADSLAAGYSCWVLRVAGRPVGYAVMMLVLDEAHLLDISIDRQAQRGGHGATLLHHLRNEARLHGATQFFLEVRPSNGPALNLYRKHGFEHVGRRRDYYPAADGREDAIVMRCEL
ncbi:ribosomal protein S18-alanine N-acetyltransferase [Thauera sinica]|uniref:[Ribosomal protein bS18]-alanine N-acetyltransferase n=1 Tax=Thauera sinica TaxID=2665146 RepID=A0ABW1AYW7_9RHOO|nr:ribosomal protein S18-alanine N-acetyltransferase [Thauera sp. K11]ATE62578.1 ribosomal-protein-alanine N-acetyltransferase [Thauera sp. K11]